MPLFLIVSPDLRPTDPADANGRSRSLSPINGARALASEMLDAWHVIWRRSNPREFPRMAVAALSAA
jgi:hypothetical protein